MNYKREIPRDFFNEGKLMKCMGLLSLKINDELTPEGLKIQIVESGEPFEILMDCDGCIWVNNYETTVNGLPAIFKLKPYNVVAGFHKDDPYPLICEINADEIEVFNDKGEFSDEFINLIYSLQKNKL